MKSECKTIIIDVDGVLVHSVFYSESGERFKSFNARDNRAIREMVAAGWQVILMSQSSWFGLHSFAERVGAIPVLNVTDKLQMHRTFGGDLPYYAIADDITDEPLLREAVKAWVPANGFHGIGPHCHLHSTDAKAGDGVVAEVWAELQTISA